MDGLHPLHHAAIELTDQRPLVGHRVGKQMNTHWITFIKEPLA